VRITEKKNSMKVENHISVHSNLNLNGLMTQDERHVGIGKEVNKALMLLNYFEISSIDSQFV
jgi:hypothetical protein